ncbi:hypothetical protein ABIA33_000722 [Streptacidiphilus sp. MAP12-16]
MPISPDVAPSDDMTDDQRTQAALHHTCPTCGRTSWCITAGGNRADTLHAGRLRRAHWPRPERRTP